MMKAVVREAKLNQRAVDLAIPAARVGEIDSLEYRVNTLTGLRAPREVRDIRGSGGGSGGRDAMNALEQFNFNERIVIFPAICLAIFCAILLAFTRQTRETPLRPARVSAWRQTVPHGVAGDEFGVYGLGV
jgi:hypothetical protein